MPSQKRWRLKRDLEQASENIETASGYIVRVGSQFRGVHDDYYDALQSIFVSLSYIKDVLNGVKDKI